MKKDVSKKASSQKINNARMKKEDKSKNVQTPQGLSVQCGQFKKNAQKAKMTRIAHANKRYDEEVAKAEANSEKKQIVQKEIRKKQKEAQYQMDKLPKVDFYDVIFKGDTKRNVCDIILANIIVLSAVILSCFIPVVSIALPILVFLYFEVGLWGFILNNELGNSCKYEELFVQIKKYIRIFCLFIVKMVLILFWTICLIVPGIIAMLNYSFAGLILYESDDLDAKGVLQLSKELVRGHRYNIFLYELLSLAVVCASMSLMFFIIMIFDIFLTVPSAVYIVLVLFAGGLSTLTLAMPMVQVAIVDNYILAKNEKSTHLV